MPQLNRREVRIKHHSTKLQVAGVSGMYLKCVGGIDIFDITYETEFRVSINLPYLCKHTVHIVNLQLV